MLLSAALLLPCIICVIWGLILLFYRGKSFSQKVLLAFLLLNAAFFFINAHYLSSEVDYVTLVVLGIISRFITLCLPPLAYIYLLSVRGERPRKWLYHVSISVPLLMGFMSALVTFLMGMDNAAQFLRDLDLNGGLMPPEYADQPLFRAQQAICSKFHNAILLIEMALLFSSIIYRLVTSRSEVWKIVPFFTGKHRSSPYSALSCLLVIVLIVSGVKIGLGRTFLCTHTGLSAALSITLAVVMFCIGYVGCWFSDADFTWRDLTETNNLNRRTAKDAPALDEEDKSFLEKETQEIESEDIKFEEIKEFEDKLKPTLLLQFIKFMSSKKPYLNTGFTISEVSEALNTNRTYISMLVNQNFNMTFRDYVNSLRINHAKELILEGPEEFPEDIAIRSGFTSDYQFVKKFKQNEGMSPRAWQASKKK